MLLIIYLRAKFSGIVKIFGKKQVALFNALSMYLGASFSEQRSNSYLWLFKRRFTSKKETAVVLIIPQKNIWFVRN